MTTYEFPSSVAMDPSLNTLVTDGQGYVYALSDQAFASPLTTMDRFGNAMNGVRTTYNGVTEEFFVEDNAVVWWASGPYAFMLISFTGLQAAALAAQAQSTAAAASADASATSAAAALTQVTTQPDAAIAGFMNNPTSLSRAALNTIIGAVGMSARTVDSDQDYRAILLSDGTVKAVPQGTTAPPTPTGLAGVAGPSSASLTWAPSTGATAYWLYRNGSKVAVLTGTSFRDAGTSGTTYTYQIAAVNQYGMRSPISTSISVFMDPSLNHAPTVAITTWPTTLPTIGSAVIRVNAVDVDAQVLAVSLAVSPGSLQPTQDPSVWVLTL